MAGTSSYPRRQLAALIAHISATPAALGRRSRDLEISVAKLVSNAGHQALGEPESETYRIDDLARLTGVTTRNIRAYRERGLLPAPRRVGRVTLYTEAHAARLRMISSMLSRGYTIAPIDELIGAWENGQQIADVLGLPADLTDIPVTESTRATTMDELLRHGIDASAAERLTRLGLLVVDDGAVRIDEPSVFDAIVALITESRPASAVIDVVEEVTPALLALGRAMTAAAATLTEGNDTRRPAGPADDDLVTDVTLTLIRLRTLAEAATHAALARSTEALLAQSLSGPDEERDAEPS